MITRILVAVDDSTPALAAAEFAIELARTLSAELRAVTVIEPERDTDAVLGHVMSLGDRAGVTTTVASLGDGKNAFEAVLAAATEWGAGLIVMGRSDKRPTGRPYVGSQTEHLLEFTEVPVVVVPENVAPAS
jgi:nucleotide-binding universal stress UspA family protein